MANLAELIHLVANKDHTAFQTIYKIHSRHLYGIALRITCHSARAEDAMQDALLQLWHNAGRFDASYGNAQAWLNSIARYRALDIVHRRGREVAYDDFPEQVDDTPDALAQLECAYNAEVLHRCLRELDVEGRRLLTLAFIDGLTHTELAVHVDRPIGTVKSSIRRSLSNFEAVLKTHDPAGCSVASAMPYWK